MEIRIEPVAAKARRPKPTDESKLGFGKLYSDHMFSMKWTPSTGWSEAKVGPYGALTLQPSALVFHYGQTVFEGLKAYRNQHGTFNLFRPQRNSARFNHSAARLDMPQVDEKVFLRAIELLLEQDHEWVPHSFGTSLYVRPTMIATEPYIGLKSSSEVVMFIITGPVGAYYPEGFNPVKITVTEKYSRAGPGGLGAAKTAANYAASLLAEKEAVKAGFTQVLWLDASEHKYVEEVGSMNIFFKIDGKVITPPLASSTILAGVTRDSVIQLLKHWKEPVEEYRVSIAEVIDAHEKGKLEEVFGAGTAAVISPVGLLNYRDKNRTIADGKTGPTAHRLFDELIGIQYGQRPDPFSWIYEIDPAKASGKSASLGKVAV
jgi:branched-chain amino acid aminotransferase